MCGKVYLASFILILCVQMSIGALNPALQKCKDKLMEQAANVKLGRYPECFHASALENVRNSTGVMQDFYQTLSDNCRSPSAADIQGCIDHFKQFMESRSTDIQAGIMGAVHSFYEATRDCIKMFVNNVGNLDQWVISGCEGSFAKQS